MFQGCFKDVSWELEGCFMGVVSLMHDEAAVAMWPILQDHKFTRTVTKRTNAFKKNPGAWVYNALFLLVLLCVFLYGSHA